MNSEGSLISKDGTIYGRYEYYEDNCIVLRVNNLCIKVWKPYRAKETPMNGEEYVSANPTIEISSNQTTCWTYNSYQYVNEAIEFAINKLNQEGNCLIDINNWKYCKSQPVPVSKIPRGFEYRTPSSYTIIKHRDGNKLYQVRGGRYWLYLGHGYAYKACKFDSGVTNIYLMNEEGNKEIYLAIPNIENIITTDNIITVRYGESSHNSRICTSVKERKKTEQLIVAYPNDIYIYRGLFGYNSNEYFIMLNDNDYKYKTTEAYNKKRIVLDIIKKAGII